MTLCVFWLCGLDEIGSLDLERNSQTTHTIGICYHCSIAKHHSMNVPQQPESTIVEHPIRTGNGAYAQQRDVRFALVAQLNHGRIAHKDASNVVDGARERQTLTQLQMCRRFRVDLCVCVNCEWAGK